MQLGFGVGGSILTAAGRLDFGLLAYALRLIGCLAQQPGGAVLGAGLDLRSTLAGRVQDASSLLTEHAGDDFFVEHCGRSAAVAARRAQLALEEHLALLQAGEFGGNHSQQIANLGRLVPAPRRGERRRRHRRG